MSVIINPGSGPVPDATREHADAAIKAFIEDVGIGSAKCDFLTADDSGRFDYLLHGEHGACEVSMPGLPLERVRYLGEDDQNIWNFPRLYVDGSSWVWCFGVDIARGVLTGKDAA